MFNPTKPLQTAEVQRRLMMIVPSTKGCLNKQSGLREFSNRGFKKHMDREHEEYVIPCEYLEHYSKFTSEMLHTHEVAKTGNSPLNIHQRKLEDTCVTKWREELWNDNQIVGGNKLCTFKINSGWEDYLSAATNKKHRVSLSRLRLSCHSLTVETGENQTPPTPADQ